MCVFAVCAVPVVRIELGRVAGQSKAIAGRRERGALSLFSLLLASISSRFRTHIHTDRCAQFEQVIKHTSYEHTCTVCEGEGASASRNDVIAREGRSRSNRSSRCLLTSLGNIFGAPFHLPFLPRSLSLTFEKREGERE